MRRHTNKEIFGLWRTNVWIIPAHSADARPLSGSEECGGRVVTLSSLSCSSGRSCPEFVVSQVTLSRPSRIHGWPPLISLVPALALLGIRGIWTSDLCLEQFVIFLWPFLSTSCGVAGHAVLLREATAITATMRGCIQPQPGSSSTFFFFFFLHKCFKHMQGVSDVSMHLSEVVKTWGSSRLTHRNPSCRWLTPFPTGAPESS